MLETSLGAAVIGDGGADTNRVAPDRGPTVTAAKTFYTVMAEEKIKAARYDPANRSID